MHQSFITSASGFNRLTRLAGALVFAMSLAAVDFDTYFAKKGIVYSQTGTGSPTLQLNNGFVFESEVDATAINFVSAVSMTSPISQVWPITVDTSGQVFQLKKKYDTSTKLNTTFPNGTFSFSIATQHDGTKTLTLPLPVDSYPNAPHLANYTSFQAIDIGRNLQALWDPFVNGTTNDFIQFRIEDLQGNKIFKTPGIGKPGALDGTARGVIIPARSLNPGQTYNGRLVFEKISKVDRTSYAGALGYSGYYTENQFPAQTATVSSPADVQSYSLSKTQRYNQTNASPGVLDAASGFRFELKVQPDLTNSMTNASVVLPNNQTNSVPLEIPGPDYDLQVDFATKALMDNAYPNGGYTVIFNTVHEGIQTISLPLTGDRYPPAPRVTNFDAAQQIKVNLDQVITWDAWPGGTVADFVQLRIEDHSGNKIWATPNFEKNGALDGTAVSATIPAGALSPGNTYQASVLFERFVVVDDISLDAASGTSGYVSRTKLSVTTVPPDVKLYQVLKRQTFEQKDANAPALLSSGNPASFEATVLDSSLNSVTNASIKLPSAATKAIPSISDGSGFLLNDTFASRTALDGSYASGTYTVNMATVHDGAKSAALQLQGDFYPAAPHVANFSNAQSIVPASDFILQWDPWTQGTTNDLIQIQIVDLAGNVIVQTKDIQKKSALDGTATAFTIPKNTLVAGVPYLGKLEFRKILVADDTTYPGSLGVSAYSSRTQFAIGTAAGGPNLTGIQLLATGSIQFQFSAATGKSYRIDTSTNLITWQAGPTNTVSASPVTITLPVDRGTKAQFYRAEVLP